MTLNKFYEHICQLDTNYQNRDLEIYLLALLKLVEQEKTQVLTSDLLLKIIQDAFIAEPKDFDVNWLRIKTAPDENVMSRKFTHSIEYTIAVLHFQIAELHKMKGKQLENKMRYFGIDSDTGNRWYNFDPMTNLECGARCMVDNSDNEEMDFLVSWQTLGELLEMGRSYE